jgi:pyruvate/2-oxoglutarate dehydrogenase complex dihydrolipoamide acyltransferase (E2) component
MIHVYLPDMGENVTKATISYWYFERGASVTEGSDLVEVATDKATFNVPAPSSGILVEIKAHEGDVVHAGDILATIEDETAGDEDDEVMHPGQ